MTTDTDTTVQDAFEDAAAEMLAEDASGFSTTNEEAEDATDSGLSEQGGLLPRMGEQTAMDGEGFEKPAKTRRELAEEFLEHFQADVEKAETALGNARRKLREAQELRDDAEENLRRAIRDENGEAEAVDEDEAQDESDAGQEVDPITGEVVTCTPSCDNCGAETCNLRQEATDDSESLGAGWGMGCGGNGWRPAGEEQEPAA